jgi:hypothetical protein
MTADELERATRAFLAQRPFRPFIVEFISGTSVLVQHPEAIHRHGDMFTCRGADSIKRVFTAGSVCQVTEAKPPPDL